LTRNSGRDNAHFQDAVERYHRETGKVSASEFVRWLAEDRPLTLPTLGALEAWTSERCAELHRRAWRGGATTDECRQAIEERDAVARHRAFR
jgi:hypothetical protein